MRKLGFWAKARALSALVALCAPILPHAVKAAEPIKVGMSMALTGGVAPIGKQVLAALQIWRDDVNAKGGLLGHVRSSSSFTTTRAIRPTFPGSIPS